MGRSVFLTALILLGGCAPEHPKTGGGVCHSDIECPLGASCDPWSRHCVSADARSIAGAFAEVEDDAGAPDPGPPPVCPVDAVPCDDGDPCTSGDACKAGACAGSAYSCDDGIACTLDACDGKGGCDYTQKAGTCLILGKCWAKGDGRPGALCESCLPSVDARNWSVDDARPCDDANQCTENDHCDAGACVSTVKSCDDADPCTLDTCSGPSGCIHDADPDCE